MKWKQNKIIIGMVLMMVLLTSIPMTAFAQMYSGTCIVTVNGKGHGTVSPEGELSVWPGEKITLQIIPDEGYKVSSVSINGVRLTDTELEEVIQTQSYSLTGIYSNTSMDVIFCSETSFNGHTYTVFGSKELCGTAQDPGAVWNDMRQTEEGKFEAVYENLNAGYYEFLIAQDHSWTNVYGSEGTQDPVGVEILEDGGTLKILFDETTGRIATEYEETLQEGQSLSAAESQSVLETADMAENMETASDANIEDRSLAISFYQEEVTDDSLEGTELMESSSSSSQTYRQVTVGYSQGGIVVPPETAWITNQGVVQIPEGETAFFSIVPDTGYQIQDIYIDGIAVTGENKTNAIALGGFWLWDTTQDHSIYVEFASSGQNEGTYRISVTVDGGGTIATSPGFTTSEDGVVYVPQGQSVSLFFYPYEGYQVQQILLDGVQISDQELQSAKNTNSFTLWQVQADHSVSISFGSGGNLSQQRTVSLTAGTGGTIYTADWLTGVTNGTISVSATQGQACQLFLIPDTGYEISQVLIDGASISAEELANVKATQSYTFTQIQGDHSLEAAFSKTSCQISFSAGIGGSLQPVLETSEEGSGTIAEF